MGSSGSEGAVVCANARETKVDKTRMKITEMYQNVVTCYLRQNGNATMLHPLPSVLIALASRVDRLRQVSPEAHQLRPNGKSQRLSLPPH